MRRIKACGELVCFAAVRRTAASDKIAARAQLERRAKRDARAVDGEGANGATVVGPVVLTLLGWTAFARMAGRVAFYLWKRSGGLSTDESACHVSVSRDQVSQALGSAREQQ